MSSSGTVRPEGVTETGAERVVLCGPDGAAVGTADKVAVHGLDTPLHLAFSCYVFDDDGRVLVTRRAYDKRTFAGVRTNSCCGHLAPGEDLPAAVARRVRDELGLELTGITLVLPTFRYRAVAADGVVENELCPVYRAVVTSPRTRSTPTISLDSAEVADAWWLPWDELITDEPGDPLSSWATEQLVQLHELGPVPAGWPAADPQLLPAAARQ